MLFNSYKIAYPNNFIVYKNKISLMWFMLNYILVSILRYNPWVFLIIYLLVYSFIKCILLIDLEDFLVHYTYGMCDVSYIFSESHIDNMWPFNPGGQGGSSNPGGSGDPGASGDPGGPKGPNPGGQGWTPRAPNREHHGNHEDDWYPRYHRLDRLPRNYREEWGAMPPNRGPATLENEGHRLYEVNNINAPGHCKTCPLELEEKQLMIKAMEIAKGDGAHNIGDVMARGLMTKMRYTDLRICLFYHLKETMSQFGETRGSIASSIVDRDPTDFDNKSIVQIINLLKKP